MQKYLNFFYLYFNIFHILFFTKYFKLNLFDYFPIEEYLNFINFYQF